VRLGLPAGSDGSGGLHESQTLEGGMKKTSGRYIVFSVGSGEGKKVWPGGCLNCFLCQIERVVEGIQFQTSRPALARP
jgi:hypothetical protein